MVSKRMSQNLLIIPFLEWEGTNKVTLEVSSMPNINLTKRLNYLIRYPHGCVEQTTSSVFPQLHLSTLLELNADEKKKIESNIKAGIERLRNMQLSNGGIGYWPGANMANEWGVPIMPDIL